MQKKGNLWMSDWRDSHGQRHRKGFATKAAAARHAQKMRREATAKKAQASAPARKSARRGPRRRPAVAPEPAAA